MQLKPVLRYIYKQGCPLETIGREHGGSGHATCSPTGSYINQHINCKNTLIFTVVNTIPESFVTGLS